MNKLHNVSVFCFRIVAASYLLGTITFNVIYFGIPELVADIPIWLLIFGSAFSISLSFWMLYKARVLQKEGNSKICNEKADLSTVVKTAGEKTRIKLLYFGAFVCWTAVMIILYMHAYTESMSNIPFWFPPALILLFAILGSLLIKLVKRKKG